MKKRLINFEAGAIGETYLADYLNVVARNIEDAMMGAGAKPGKDYTYNDLYRLALPFAIENAKAGELKWSHKEREGPLVGALVPGNHGK